jgi:hypothetical protein
VGGQAVIKAVIHKPDGTTLVLLGLSRMNTDRLHDDKPIPVDLGELLPDLGKAVTVALFAGETDAAIAAHLRAQVWTPQGGVPEAARKTGYDETPVVLTAGAALRYEIGTVTRRAELPALLRAAADDIEREG